MNSLLSYSYKRIERNMMAKRRIRWAWQSRKKRQEKSSHPRAERLIYQEKGKKPWEYTLTEEEQEYVTFVAKERRRRNKEIGRGNKQKSPKRPLRVERMGVAGEYICSILLDVLISLSTHPREGGIDGILRVCRKSVEIRTREKPNADLLVPVEEGRNKEADIYILVKGKWPTYRICGWVTKRQVFSRKPSNETGTPNYIIKGEVGWGKLRPIEELPL